MKKIKFIIFSMLLMLLSATCVSAKELMVCEYYAHWMTVRDADDNAVNQYLKMKITYNDDKTSKLFIFDVNDRLIEFDGGTTMYGLYTNEGRKVGDTGSFELVLSGFDDLESHYKAKQCPNIETVDMIAQGYTYQQIIALPPEVKSDNGDGFYNASLYNSNFSDESGNKVESKAPKLNKQCPYNVKLEYGETVNAIFRMFDDGSKEVEIYMNGQKDGNEIKTSIPLGYIQSELKSSKDYGRTYKINITKEEINKIFEQKNMSQISNNTFNCPSNIYIYDTSKYQYDFYITTTEDEAQKYDNNATAVEGETDTEIKFGDFYNPFETYEPQNPLVIKPIHLCTKGSGGLKVMQIVGYILYIMKILVPLILIIMASVDLAKGVITSNEKPNAEVIKKLIIRVLIGIIIFIIPSVLDFLLSFVDGASGTMDNDGKFTKCTDCLLDPFGDCTK